MPDMRPREYDPELTDRLLEEGEHLLDESRRLLDDLDARLHDPSRTT